MPSANDRVGPYTLIKQLGKGAFGIVWLAEKRTEIATTKVAIKIAIDEEPDLEAIKGEANLWAKIGGHPNVLPMIEANIYEGQVVIVSEYAPDGSLEGWMKRNGGKAPSIETAIAMTMGILSGLEHLHAERILHRDLKPANILLQGETPRLADFGLSRVLKTNVQTTQASGTPVYMSPEAFNGKKVIQTDLWSTGIIFYQLLSGNVPFPVNDYAALVGAICLREPEPLPATIPKEFQEIIRKALEKEVKNRYQSATEMKRALQESLRAKSNNPEKRGFSKALYMIGLIVGIVILGVGFFFIVNSISSSRTAKEQQAINKPAENATIKMEFVNIPVGEFMMGSENGYDSEKPIHKVIITRSYEMGAYEVTQEQWEGVMGSNPSNFKGAKLPVERVSWDDVQEFIEKLNSKSKKYSYRLPTEAEWEYACRAGTTGDYGGTGKLAEMGWYEDNAGSTTHEVGQKKANAWGLYDMHGNVWEWCSDWYGSYSSETRRDPSGAERGAGRVLRGGGWYYDANSCRSAYRSATAPGARHDAVGFRLVRSPK